MANISITRGHICTYRVAALVTVQWQPWCLEGGRFGKQCSIECTCKLAAGSIAK